METNRTDNYASTMSALALFILNNAPTACRQERELQSVVSDFTASRHSDTFYLDFRGPDDDCDASLQVGFDSWRSEYVKDETGVWVQMKLQVKVGWPSWGATEVGLASKRINLMYKVTDLAKAIDHEYGGLKVWRQIYTPEEVAKQDAEKEERRIRTALDNVIETHCKHMRVGSSREVGPVENVPNGRYEANLGDKKYYVQVHGNGLVYFTREC